MPLPTEISQYPIARHPRAKKYPRQKPPAWWGYSSQRLENPWDIIARPYVFLPMWKTYPAATFRDISPYGRHGTCSAGQSPAFAGSEMGQSFQFDEVDDRITIANFQYETNQSTVLFPFTLLFWFRITDNSGSQFQYIFTQGGLDTSNSINIYIPEALASGAGVIRLNIRLSGGSRLIRNIPAGGWVDGRWHSYALTLNALKTGNLYADGLLRDGPFVPAGSVYNPTNVIRLGCNGDSTPNVDRFYGGQIAMFAIMRGAWSADQVRAWHQDPWAIVRAKRRMCVNFRPADTEDSGTDILPEELGPSHHGAF